MSYVVEGISLSVDLQVGVTVIPVAYSGSAGEFLITDGQGICVLLAGFPYGGYGFGLHLLYAKSQASVVLQLIRNPGFSDESHIEGNPDSGITRLRDGVEIVSDILGFPFG